MSESPRAQPGAKKPQRRAAPPRHWDSPDYRPTKEQRIAHIRDALCALTDAYLAHEAARPPGPIRFIPAVQFLELGVSWPEEYEVRDPVGEALRTGIRRMGELLFPLGGIQAMQAALNIVAERDGGRRFQRVASLLDHAWNGVGGKWVS
jgi:hypothetical protein